jgi:hypothetical protein
MISVMKIDRSELREQFFLGVERGDRLESGDTRKMVISIWSHLPRLEGNRSVRRAVDNPNRLVKWKRGEPLAKIGIEDNLDSIRRCDWRFHLTRYIRKFVFNCEHFFAYFWKARGSRGDAAVVNRGQAKGATWKSPLPVKI